MNNDARNHLITENQHFLKQLESVLADLQAETYRHSEWPFARGGIGKHVRHVLEFYGALLSGAPVDYDARKRDPELETVPQAAVERIRDTVVRLHALGSAEPNGHGADSPLTVICAPGDGTARATTSTVERELQFLSSHTVHHLAIIAIIMQYLGIEVPAEFGVAPSTLAHERASRNGA